MPHDREKLHEEGMQLKATVNNLREENLKLKTKINILEKEAAKFEKMVMEKAMQVESGREYRPGVDVISCVESIIIYICFVVKHCVEFKTACQRTSS